MINRKLLFISIITSISLMGCSVSDKDNIEQDASLKFYLTDNPGEYQQVNIDIEEIRVIVNDSLYEITSYPGIYNLLDFTNGRDTLLADAEFGEGFLSQVRLVLGENNSVMVDSILHDLRTPSAQSSGLKLNVHEEIVPGEAYAYVIDFDAQKSIVRQGNGRYSLKPVIRVFTEVLTGSVHGIVSPPEADSLISLIRPQDTISTVSDSVGNFMFRGLDPGTYSIDILATHAFSDSTLSEIEVFAGLTTELDTIFFE
jgi:hypothetical protein